MNKKPRKRTKKDFMDFALIVDLPLRNSILYKFRDSKKVPGTVFIWGKKVPGTFLAPSAIS